MKFRKEDRAEFARSIYVALLARGELPSDPAQIADALKAHFDQFEAALMAMKQPDFLMPEDNAVVAGRRRRESLGRRRLV